jgi:RecA-family ATPase
VSFLDLMPFEDLDDQPIVYRVQGILPNDGHTLLSAYAKTGKSTLALHLMKALDTGSEFLGRSAKKTADNMVYLNFELGERTLRRYATNIGLSLSSRRLRTACLRGQAEQFRDISDPASEVRTDLIRDLRKVRCELLVVDPLAALTTMMGLNSDNNDEVRLTLEVLGTIAEEVDCQLIIIDHTGHADRTRARGASAKLDWADTIWNLQGEKDEPRTLEVTGRDVEFSKIFFTMNAEYQLETCEEPVSDKSQNKDKFEKFKALYEEYPGWEQKQFMGALGISQPTCSRWMKRVQ